MASYYDEQEPEEEVLEKEEEEEEEDAERFRRLLENIDTAPDLDRKISALQHLADYLPTFHTIPEADGLTISLKTLIKDPHPTLSHAALDLISPFVSHLRGLVHDSGGVGHLKTAITSLMPSVLERTGDTKEKAREVAAKALEELGKAAIDATKAVLGHSASHKTSETPLNLYERMLCDVGLMAKSAKIKEQTCKVLPLLRSYYPRMPIKVFLSPLVELLSDADPHCREAARVTLVALFSKASAAAKTDLKNELGLQNVRKTLVDAIIREISGDDDDEFGQEPSRAAAAMTSTLSASRSPPLRSDAGISAAASAPAGTAASDDNISPVHIFSRSDLERAFGTMLTHFEGKETEHNWLQRENSIIKTRGMLKAGAYDKYNSAFVAGIKSLTDGILKAVGSLRTTLAMQGISLITELAHRVGDDLADATIDTFVSALLKMAGYTKRLVANATQDAVKTLYQNVSYRHRFLDLIWVGIQDKNITTRISMAEHLHTLLVTHVQHHKHALEGHDGLATIEKFLKKSLADQNKDVRANAREAYYVYRQYWPVRGQALEGALEPSIRKQIAAAAPDGKLDVRPAKAAPQSRIVSTALPPSSANTDTSPSLPKVAGGGVAGPSRRAGGPSNAILAAKARMVAEKREQDARQYRMSPDADFDEAGDIQSPSSTADSTPKRLSFVQTRQVSASRLTRPAEIPLPPSPSSSTFSAGGGRTPGSSRSPSGSVAARRTGSATSPPSSIPKTPRRTDNRLSNVAMRNEPLSASTIASAPATDAQDHIQQRFQPFQPTRARNLSTSTAGSSGAASTSISNGGGSANPRTIQMQPLLGFNGYHGADHANGLAKGKSVGQVSPKVHDTVLPSKGADPDDTVQLGKHDGDATLDADATVDLMGMSSSPLRGSLGGDDGGGGGGFDDSLNFAFAGLGRAGTVPQTTDESVADEEQAAGDETAQSTPKIARRMWTAEQNGPSMPSQHSKASSQPATPSAGMARVTSATRKDRSIEESPAEGKSYLASRASRLASQAPRSSSGVRPLQSSPEALQWIEDLRLGKANVKTLTLLADLSKSHPVRAVHAADKEDEAAIESLGHQEVESWRHSNLFCSLWEALERSILSLLASSTGTDDVAVSTSPPPSEIAMASVSLLYKLVENQYPLFLSYALETDLLSLIFKIRASASSTSGPSGSRHGMSGSRGQALTSIASASDALIDSWAEQTLPALGVSSLLSSMGPLAPSPSSSSSSSSSSLQSLAASSPTSSSAPAAANDPRILTLSLRALSRLLLRLPSEMVLEEVPRARGWILCALNDEKVTTLRMAAVDVLSCAQVRIEEGRSEDESTVGPSAGGGGGGGGEAGNDASPSDLGAEGLFEVVGPLKQAQKDLLMYYIGMKRKTLARQAQQLKVKGAARGTRG